LGVRGDSRGDGPRPAKLKTYKPRRVRRKGPVAKKKDLARRHRKIAPADFKHQGKRFQLKRGSKREKADLFLGRKGAGEKSEGPREKVASLVPAKRKNKGNGSGGKGFSSVQSTKGPIRAKNAESGGCGALAGERDKRNTQKLVKQIVGDKRQG